SARIGPGDSYSPTPPIVSLNPSQLGTHGFEAFRARNKVLRLLCCYTTSAERRRWGEGLRCWSSREINRCIQFASKTDDIVDKCPYIQTQSNWLELSMPIAAIARCMKLK